MKNILKLSFLGLVTLFMITSCEVDPVTDPGPGGGGTTDLGPEIIFGTGTGLLSSDTTLEPGAIFTVQLQAAKGTSLLKSLEVLENGVRLEDFANRLQIAGSPAPSSAVLIPADDQDAFTWDVTIKAQEANNKTIYKFLLKDENDNEAFTDIEIDTEVTNSGSDVPSIKLNGNSNVILDAGTLISFPIEVLKGSTNLASISVWDLNDVNDPDDDELIDAARCYFGSSDNQFTENPMTLSVDDQSGFSKTVFIRAQADQSVKNYAIAIFDEAQNLELVQVTLNTFPGGISGNPTTEILGVLFNKAGPAGTGGLDLDNGDSTGSSDAAAELKDNGIDINVGAATNWLQRISGTNGTILKQLIPNSNGLSETFTFGSVVTDAAIRDIWGNATDLTGTNSDLDPWTEEVQVGDMFIAERDGKYYMMNITEVFIDPAGNDDFYRMDIKF